MIYKKIIWLMVFIIILFLFGCGMNWGEHRYFSNAEKAIAYFERNQAAFQDLVEQWEKSDKLDDFGYRIWDNESIVWNDTVISLSSGGYIVKESNGVATSVIDLGRAAEIVGTNEETLNRWREKAKKYEIQYISTMGTALPKGQRYIEISMRGSERGPYGYIYVPVENKFVPQVDGVSSYILVKPLGRRWFYFESKL